MTTRDGYCRLCRKMVPLVVFSDVLVLHYTFKMVSRSVDNSPESCPGTVPDNTITHWMDDPKAASE